MWHMSLLFNVYKTPCITSEEITFIPGIYFILFIWSQIISYHTSMHFLTEVQTDVKLLLECLKCQVNNQSAVKQALLTLSSIFSTYGRYMIMYICCDVFF